MAGFFSSPRSNRSKSSNGHLTSRGRKRRRSYHVDHGARETQELAERGLYAHDVLLSADATVDDRFYASAWLLVHYRMAEQKGATARSALGLSMPKQTTDTALPAWAEQLTRLLDDRFAIPGTNIRFGVDSLLGLVPGGGDAFGAVATLSLFALALQKGVPREVLVRMAINVAIDAAAGTVPLLGDVFDVAFKANRKNLQLIQQSLPDTQGQLPRRSSLRDKLFIAGVLLLVVSALLLPIVLVSLVIFKLFD